MKEREKIKIYAIDIDNTLTLETCWTEEQCLNATPNKKVIEFVKKLIEDSHFVYFYTGRRDRLMGATFKWLKNQGLPAIVSNWKMPFDYLLDDKSFNPTEEKWEIIYKGNHKLKKGKKS